VTSLYDKQKSLWDQKIGSEVQYLSAKNNKEALENRIATIKDQIETMKIKSPINGSVEEVTIRVGQAVSPGLTFFRIVNFSKVKVVADVSENYSALIKNGDEVILYFPDIEHEISANIDFTSKYISPINRTFAVQIYFNPDKYEYRANMIAVIKIRNYYSPKALTVPVNIIQNDVKGKYVYSVESIDGKMVAKRKDIKEGEEYSGMVEITDGLKAGDKIITTGYQNLEEGTLIKL
jgi:membrane fusion protein, multidrug efflux system